MSQLPQKVTIPSLTAPVRLSRCCMLWSWFLFCGIQPLHAGMTSYGVDSVAGFRLQALSFFLFLLLVLSWGV